jgi:hypothetical protein
MALCSPRGGASSLLTTPTPLYKQLPPTPDFSLSCAVSLRRALKVKPGKRVMETKVHLIQNLRSCFTEYIGESTWHLPQTKPIILQALKVIFHQLHLLCLFKSPQSYPWTRVRILVFRDLALEGSFQALCQSLPDQFYITLSQQVRLRCHYLLLL